MARTALVPLLLGSLFVACTPGDGGSPPPTHETEAASPSPTRAAFVNGGDCTAEEIPGVDLESPAGCISSITENGETLLVYAVLDGDSRPRSWRIHLTTDEGDLDQQLPAGNAFSYPRAVGSANVVGDERPEWWVKVKDYTSHGAPWSALHLFVSKARSLEPVRVQDEPLNINYGGTSRLGEGAHCRPGALTLMRAVARNPRNTRWEISERRYLLQGAKAALDTRKEGVLFIKGYNDPDLDPYFHVRCQGLEIP